MKYVLLLAIAAGVVYAFVKKNKKDNDDYSGYGYDKENSPRG